MRRLVIRFESWLAVSCVCVACGCSVDPSDDRGPADKLTERHAVPAEDRVAARVDGVPITVDDVQGLIDEADGGLSPSEALDALVRQQLLAAEAERRGFGRGEEVAAERRKALAAALLEQQAAAVSVDTLDQQRLRAVYDSSIDRFVHGPERSVIHALARTGKKLFGEEQAREVIGRVHAAVRDAKTAKEFRAAVKPLIAEHGKKRLKVETPPPFHAESKRLVAPFVEATFALDGPGKVSEPFQTRFGWHVLLVLEELPAEDVQFEEAREIIGAEVVPLERQKRVEVLVEELRGKAGVFVYGEGAASEEGQQ